MEEKQNFEESLSKLEKLVSEMESGRLSLDEMMSHFEAGKKLVKDCSAELERVRQRIEKIVNPSSEPPQVEPMELI